MLDGLGVTHLVAVAGPSFGGYQAFQWAVTYPDAMDGVVAVVTAPRGHGGQEAVDTLADAPGRRSGVERRLALRSRRDCRDDDGPARRDAPELRHPGGPGARRSPTPPRATRRSVVRRAAWAREFDPNSLLALRKASVVFDAERDFAKIRAKVLYVLSRTDKLFPPSLAPGVMDQLARGRCPGNVLRDRHGARPRRQRSGVGQVGSDAPRLPGRFTAVTGHRRHAVRHRQAAEICVVRSPKWRFPSLWRSFPGADVALAGPPGGAARRALALAGVAGSHRRPPARCQERGLGRRQPLSRAPPERAGPPRRACLHGPGLPVARRP